MTAGDVYRALWRHKFFIALLTAACVLATWYATSLQTSRYEASTLVRIQSTSLKDSQDLARTYSEIIDSGALNPRIRRLVAGQVPPQDASGVKLSSRPVEGLELLWISAQSADPARAAVVANAGPRALESFIGDTSKLGDKVVTVKAATIPSSPVSPDTSLNVAIALVLGLIFNSALVLLFEAFRDRLPEPEELGQALGYPVLATIPTLRLRQVTAVERRMDEVDIFAVAPRDGTPVGLDDSDPGRPRNP